MNSRVIRGSDANDRYRNSLGVDRLSYDRGISRKPRSPATVGDHCDKPFAGLIVRRRQDSAEHRADTKNGEIVPRVKATRHEFGRSTIYA